MRLERKKGTSRFLQLCLTAAAAPVVLAQDGRLSVAAFDEEVASDW